MSLSQFIGIASATRFAQGTAFRALVTAFRAYVKLRWNTYFKYSRNYVCDRSSINFIHRFLTKLTGSCIIRPRQHTRKTKNMAFARLVTYWLTILTTCWTLAYMYFCNAEKAFRRFDHTSDMVRLYNVPFLKTF
jgi:hypothetical protein